MAYLVKIQQVRYIDCEDRERGEAAAFAWLELYGTPEVLEPIRAEGFACRLLWSIEPPTGLLWSENGDFTRGFLATLKRVAGQNQFHEF